MQRYVKSQRKQKTDTADCFILCVLAFFSVAFSCLFQEKCILSHGKPKFRNAQFRTRGFGTGKKNKKNMLFVSRQEEIAQLHTIKKRSLRTAQFTVLTGRRRIGKTSLVLKAYEDDASMLYFFVSRKSEVELCHDFTDEMVNRLGVKPLGRAERFADIFSFLMDYSKEHPLTLMIDEFQDFMRVNASVFSDMQRIWDLGQRSAKINLVVCGSINTLMNKLFRDNKEPLYGRQTEFLRLEPFTPSVLKEILVEYNPSYTNEDLLALYLLTGGVPKYVELLIDAEAYTMREMLHRMACKNSFFLDEGRNILIEEFGRDYARYFEILSLIASGYNTRSDIEGIMHSELGGYMTRLERDYGLIEKHKPMLQKSDNKNIHYAIRDIFLRFWFRFMYKYSYVIEANAYEKLETIIIDAYPTYSGWVLEQYFKALAREKGLFTRIDSWWDRKGENEIDMIAVDDLSRRITFYEIKRQALEISLPVLEKKMERFLTVNHVFCDYEKQIKGLSMDDM